MTQEEFAQKIKVKYPQYKDVDTATLVTKIVDKYPEYKPQISDIQPTGIKETVQDIKQTGQGIAEVAKSRFAKGKEALMAGIRGDQSIKSTIGQMVGQGAGAVSDIASEVAIGAGKTLLPQGAETSISETTQKVVSPIVQSQPIKSLIAKYEELKQTNPEQARNIDALLGISSLVLDVGTLGGAKVATTAGKEALETGVKQVLKTGAETVAKVARGTETAKDMTLKFIAPEVDDATKTILKETPTAKFDEAERIAKEASIDPRKPSSFEVVGEKIAEATKQLDNQRKSLAQQKQSIISKAKNGLADFTKETGNIILEINRTLKNSKIGNQFIQRLKSVKTKVDADKAIDELQDILYKGNKDLTIPKGSSEDKILKGLLGRYNTSLKNGLPKSYTNLNAKISNRSKIINELNKSLSDVIEGVPSRGASLVKQFFSPSGTKAKELFAYIKKNTGIDIAQDATVAKFMAEMYGDVKARSLLQGLPTSTTGVIDKTLEFAVEKTGLGKGLREASKTGGIKKARSLTK